MVRPSNLVAAFGALSLLACGGSKFGSGGAAGEAGAGGLGAGGGSGQGGTSGAGGVGATAGSAGATGGSSGSAGASGVGGSAGNAGKGGGGGSAASCSCAPAQYCRSGTCRDCSDLSSIEIDTPQAVLDHPTSGLRFPRVGDSRQSLFLTLLGPSRSELWYAADPTGAASVALGDGQTPSRSGLLYFEDEGGLGFEVLFDELANGQRSIASALWDGTTLSSILPVASPLSPGGFDDYSIALAPDTGRAYWMTTRDGGPTLRTGVLGSGNEDLLELQIPTRSAGVTCSLAGIDATPWVSLEGRLLVFRALPRDAQCQPVDGDATDLYAVALDPGSGMPVTPVVPLAGANVTGGESTETDPSFSPDLCTLNFASDGGSESGFDFRLYRASRR
jgi:hypothetical protein